MTPDLADLAERQQKLALEYLSITLAIRDREQLIAVLCHSSPDLLTSSIRSILPAYDPIIRGLHNACDLSGGVSDLEAFLNDLIAVSTVSKPKDGTDPKLPSVEDYVTLLRNHQYSSHKFIHQVLKNGSDLSKWYHAYAEHAAKQYAQKTPTNLANGDIGSSAAGDFTPQLESLISTLSPKDKETVISELSAHSTYLKNLTQSSENSMRTILSNLQGEKSETQHGPGMYLTRWQALMDETPITPLVSKGPVRNGKNESVRAATTVDIDGEKKADPANVEKLDESLASPPDVSNTIRLLVSGFKETIRQCIES